MKARREHQIHLWVIVSHQAWILGSKLKSSGRAASVLTSLVISRTLYLYLYCYEV